MLNFLGTATEFKFKKKLNNFFYIKKKRKTDPPKFSVNNKPEHTYLLLLHNTYVFIYYFNTALNYIPTQVVLKPTAPTFPTWESCALTISIVIQGKFSTHFVHRKLKSSRATLAAVCPALLQL